MGVSSILLWGFVVIVLVNWLIVEMIDTMVMTTMVLGIDITDIIKSIFVIAINLISFIILRSMYRKGDDE